MSLETTNEELILRFSPQAISDIKETWHYLSEQGEKIAENLIRNLSEKCQLLSQNPKLGRQRDDLILNLRQFPYKRYNIFYFPTEFGVEIYRVLHSSRDIVQVFDDIIEKKE